MEYSSLVLMEKDKETGFIKREVGSFEVNEGAEYVQKFFMVENIVSLYFDTKRDVEEWEFSAIFDLFDKKPFIDEGFSIEDETEEYNPTFVAKFEYEPDYLKMKEKVDKCIDIIKTQMEKAFIDIEGKENDYK